MKSKICSKTESEPSLRIDEIGFGELELIQDPAAFCYGVDAVILAHFAATKAGNAKKAMDLGTGTGVIPLILSYMTEIDSIVGLEVQAQSHALACRNVALNELTGRVKMLLADVASPEILQEEYGTFDLVVTNPPYVKKSGGIQSSVSAKRVARHETTAGLSEFIKAAGLYLREKGDFCMVHRPERLVDICEACREYRLEPKTMRFVSPDRNKAPNILLIHCVKYGGKGLKILDPLYVYEDDGGYSKEIRTIYER